MSKRYNVKSRESDDKEGKEKSRDRSSRRPRSGSSRGSRKSDDRDTTRNGNLHAKSSSANDVTWYTKSPSQVNNVANVSFMDALGTPFHLIESDTANNFLSTQRGVPGVMTLRYTPTFGNPKDPKDPINVAAQKTYAYVRYYNSGSRNYYAPDLMKYIAVMDSAFAYAGFLIRTYGLMNAYSTVNRYWPEAILRSCQVDVDSLRHNLAPFRTYINNYISKVNSLAVPNSLPIFNRHFWMCSNVYKDADNLFAQVYVNMPHTYALYNPGSGDVNFYKLGGAGTNYMDFAYLTATGDKIINSIMATEDFNIMSGDIIKAFGNNVFRINGIEPNFILYPVYDAGVLNQMMNAVAIGNPVGDTGTPIGGADVYVYGLYEDPTSECIKLGRRVTPDPTDPSQDYFRQGLICATTNTAVPNAGFNAKQATARYTLNLTVDDPTPLHVIESTRLTATCHVYGADPLITDPAWTTTPGSTRLWLVLDDCGADVYLNYRFTYTYEVNGQLTFDQTSTFITYNCLDIASVASAVKFAEEMSMLSSFDWHPVVWNILNDGSTTYCMPPFIDFYRCAQVTKDVIARMHEVANLSLFDVTLENSLKM